MRETSMPLIELLQKRDGGDFLRAVARAVLQLLMGHEVEGAGPAGRCARGEPAGLARRLPRPGAEGLAGISKSTVSKLEPRGSTNGRATSSSGRRPANGARHCRSESPVARSPLGRHWSEPHWRRSERPWRRRDRARLLGATCLEPRQGGRIISVAAMIAVALDTEDREIVDLGLGPSEAETCLGPSSCAD